jgi:circadian clock protein KaiB
LDAPQNKAADFERTLAEADDRGLELRLFVAGAGPRSARAIADLKRLCRQFDPARCKVEIVDIYQQPERAAQAQIVAVPTLVREEPRPLLKLVGELGEPARIVHNLGFVPT